MSGVVIKRDHQGGDIPGYHEPVWLGHIVFRDSAGRPHQHGRTRFASVVCNNPGCKYEALVNAEVVVQAAATKRGRRR